MKHISKFEEFGTNESMYTPGYKNFRNTEEGERIKKRFSEPTYPALPFKRDLTEEEHEKMRRHFNDHSWSNIDKNGRIVLGGGEEDRGWYYITEGDLAKLS